MANAVSSIITVLISLSIISLATAIDYNTCLGSEISGELPAGQNAYFTFAINDTDLQKSRVLWVDVLSDGDGGENVGMLVRYGGLKPDLLHYDWGITYAKTGEFEGIQTETYSAVKSIDLAAGIYTVMIYGPSADVGFNFTFRANLFESYSIGVNESSATTVLPQSWAFLHFDFPYNPTDCNVKVNDDPNPNKGWTFKFVISGHQAEHAEGMGLYLAREYVPSNLHNDWLSTAYTCNGGECEQHIELSCSDAKPGEYIVGVWNGFGDSVQLSNLLDVWPKCTKWPVSEDNTVTIVVSVVVSVLVAGLAAVAVLRHYRIRRDKRISLELNEGTDGGAYRPAKNEDEQGLLVSNASM